MMVSLLFRVIFTIISHFRQENNHPEWAYFFIFPLYKRKKACYNS